MAIVFLLAGLWWLLILLGLAIGLLLTPVGLLYTDIAAGLVIFTQVWFFATPVVYPAPESFPLSLLATAGWHVLLVPRAARYLPHATVSLMLGLNLFVWFCELIPLYYQPLLG